MTKAGQMRTGYGITVTTLGAGVCLVLMNVSGYAADAGVQITAPASGPSERLEPNKTAIAIDIKDLCQHWVHSREEEQPGGKDQIFRPAASKAFPPSRFRMAYKFTPNGACEFMFLSPSDAHHFKPGKWMLDTRDQTLLKITADGTTQSYRIVELSKNILRLTPLEPKTNKHPLKNDSAAAGLSARR